MPRFLTIFGALLGAGGVLAGAAFLFVRYGAYSDSMQMRRGPFAPMLWHLSLGTGTLVITLSALFGFLLFMLGRMLARVERLEAEVRRGSPDQALEASPASDTRGVDPTGIVTPG